MSSGTQVNCGADPTPAEAKAQAQAALQQKVKEEAKRLLAKRLLALRKGPKKSSDNSYAGAAKTLLAEQDPDPAPAKDPAPAPDQGWTMVGRDGKPIGPNGFKKKKKPKAQPWGAPKKRRLPPKEFIDFLKKQVEVLNHRMRKAKRDNKSKEAEDLQRQINRLWGKMKRAEKRLLQSGCRRWNAQQGGLRKKHTLGDYIVRK